MNWYIEEERLDEFQRRVYNLPPETSLIVKGAAGSGKTNLALWRAKYLQTIEGKNNYTVLIYTKALRRFIESGLLFIGLKQERVVNYHQWIKNPVPVDYIIVDEAQDFTKEQIEMMMEMKQKSIVFFCDDAQQLYADKNAVKTIELADITKLPVADLPFNYRLPITVAKFSQYLSSNDLTSNCKNTIGALKPRILRFARWQDELDFIIREINTRNLFGSGTESTAILLPFTLKTSTGKSPQHYSVQNAYEYFKSKNFNCLHKMYDDIDLDFDSTLPKIMPYNSAKGLQFDTVFVPHCGENWAVYKNPLYVALTRTSRNLIVTYSDRLSIYISKIPNNLGLYEVN